MLNRTPKITWGAAFANTLEIAFFLDVVAYSEPREAEFVKNAAGVEDAWIPGSDQVLAGTWGWIPTADEAAPLATGWDGAAGVRAFLEWARQKNQFRWFPDRTLGAFQPCYLVEPLRGEPPIETDGTRRLRMVIRSADDSVFTGY